MCLSSATDSTTRKSVEVSWLPLCMIDVGFPTFEQYVLPLFTPTSPGEVGCFGTASSFHFFSTFMYTTGFLIDPILDMFETNTLDEIRASVVDTSGSGARNLLACPTCKILFVEHGNGGNPPDIEPTASPYPLSLGTNAHCNDVVSSTSYDLLVNLPTTLIEVCCDA
jgi:hypothetical protein